MIVNMGLFGPSNEKVPRLDEKQRFLQLIEAELKYFRSLNFKKGFDFKLEFDPVAARITLCKSAIEDNMDYFPDGETYRKRLADTIAYLKKLYMARLDYLRKIFERACAGKKNTSDPELQAELADILLFLESHTYTKHYVLEMEDPEVSDAYTKLSEDIKARSKGIRPIKE
jgi:hypothetical protein